MTFLVKSYHLFSIKIKSKVIIYVVFVRIEYDMVLYHLKHLARTYSRAQCNQKDQSSLALLQPHLNLKQIVFYIFNKKINNTTIYEYTALNIRKC